MINTSTEQLQITVNGQARLVTPLQMISDLVSELRLDPRKVAIERNLALVPRSAYDSTPIMDGDTIEIVGFIGGG